MRYLIASAILVASVQISAAATVQISVNPLATAGFDPNDGIRQVAGAGAISVPTFDPSADSFLLSLAAFGVDGPLAFVNALAADLPASGFNTIVLQDSDNDGDPATAFNAGTAANLIAGALSDDTSGFFVYFNSVLNINRLVFSTNLNSTTSDLAILAAIQSPTGAGAIAALPQFSAANFQEVAPVPLPAALPMLGAALAGLAMVRRRRRV
jgi:hypothetical protein